MTDPDSHGALRLAMGEEAPTLSVVLPTDHPDTSRRTVRHLRHQSARDELELVIVAPPETSAQSWRKELDGFRHVSLVEIATLETLPKARAAGVRAARAPVVVFAETHSFPDSDWAAALIAAHRGPWAAVGPVIGNANPRRPASWGSLFVDYGDWVEPKPSGPVAHLPGHNTSYKRSVLLPYGEQLDRALEAESVLQWRLTEQGHRIFLESAARTRHHNITRPLPAAVERFHANRLFATARAQGWPRAKRVAYAAASPVIPAVRLYRIVRDLRRTGHLALLPRVLPTVVLALAASTVGEALGYVTGRGDSHRRLSDYELHRERYADEPEDAAHVDPARG